MVVARALCWGIVVLALACGDDRRAKVCSVGDPSCGAPQDGERDAGVDAAAMMEQVDPNLRVELQDITHAPVIALPLQCAGDCVVLEAVVRGGNPPYHVSWSDGSTDARHRLCSKTAREVSVSVTDSTSMDVEFPYEARTVTAKVKIGVRPCSHVPNPCPQQPAPPGSFDPVVKWTWDGAGSVTTPLVAQLTDDNGDGAVNQKDTPDVVIVEGGQYAPGEIVVLDGATGKEHFKIPHVASMYTPALGDIDGDKLVDIVAIDDEGKIAAHKHDGTLMWTGALVEEPHFGWAAAVALADLDHDGSPEIIAYDPVCDAKGKKLWSTKKYAGFTSAVAVDLDDDGFLEVIWGPAAYRHDGTPYYQNADLGADDDAAGGGFATVVDLEHDGSPEVIVSLTNRIYILDRAGRTLRQTLLQKHHIPAPSAAADLDGDRKPELLISDGDHYLAFSADLKKRWSEPIDDSSGAASSTAFDFLGDGLAEAVFGDQTSTWVFDGPTGQEVFRERRGSTTAMEYPSVADVDADGSADILVVSDDGDEEIPTLQVLSDRDGRWIPARQIMNQETYHVTNVNDDGTIPKRERPHWLLNNSFRAQAQLGDDGFCVPIPE